MGAKWRLAAVTALLALATACGSDSGGDKVASLDDGKGGTSQNSTPGGENKADGKTDEDQMRDFAKCMREQGVDMPDPKPGGATMLPSGDPETMKKAGEVCNKLLPNGGKPKPLSAAELDKKRQEAKCLREHGIDMPDPEPNGEPSKGLEFGDMAKLEKALKDCGVTMRGK